MNTELSQDEAAYLKLFTGDVYTVDMPRDVAKSLEMKGLVKWVPPILGTCWTITDKGREWLREASS